MFLVLLFLTLCLHVVDFPWWQPRTGVMTHGGAATRPRAPASCRAHPVPVAVATAAVPAPAAPPLGRHQGPEPRAGWKVSIRPQPTRAPRREAMALGPLRGRGVARAVARVPTKQWGVGGTTGGTAAVALLLPLPPGGTGVVAGGPPPPPGRARALGGPGGEHCLSGERRQRGCTSSRHQGPSPRPADLEARRGGGDANRGHLPAKGGPPAATDHSLWAHRNGGGSEPDRPGALLGTPGAGGGGNGGGTGPGTGPGSPPPGMAPVSGPPARPEGVYTPTAHEGAPG